MTDLREDFPHIILIAKADIKKRDFDTNLNNAIASFERRWASWKGIQLKKYEAGDYNSKKALEVLTSESEILAQHIYNYFVEDDEQVEDASVSKMADQIKDVIDEPVANSVKDSKLNTTPTVDDLVPEPTHSDNEPITTPIADDSEPDDSDEKVLHKLFKEGKVKDLSKRALGDAGLDISFWSDLTSTGMKCGKYRLHKKAKEEFYNLEKI